LEEIRIIAIDDEEAITHAIQTNLSDYNIVVFNDPEAALEELIRTPYQIIIIDEIMPKLRGIGLLSKTREACRHPFIAIMLSAYIDKELSQKAINSDLIDYMLDKPIKFALLKDKINICVGKIKREQEENSRIERIKNENEQLTRDIKSFKEFIYTCEDQTMVVCAPSIKKIVGQLDKFAKSNESCLIQGETGTGKEKIAYLLHQKSGRSGKSYVKVNCAAIPESLFESEMFGHEAGAYTGASKMKIGKFEMADNGTLFLDEIGDLPLSQQSKILCALEDGEISRIGGTKPIKINVRIVCATNTDLLKMAEEGKFRKDLYYRINVLQIFVPPLRERVEDIPVLSRYFLMEISNKEGGVEKNLTEEALEYLKNLAFPGNIRELKNLIHRAYHFHEREQITEKDIKMLVNNSRSQETEPIENKIPPVESLFEKNLPLREFKDFVERLYIASQLKKHQDNKTETAQALKIDPANFFRKLKKLRLTSYKS
jgi:two-component system nitrogen regulation response regulator NtrX